MSAANWGFLGGGGGGAKFFFWGAEMSTKFSFPPEHPLTTPKWGLQNEFSGIPRTEAFGGNSTENLNF